MRIEQNKTSFELEKPNKLDILEAPIVTDDVVADIAKDRDIVAHLTMACFINESELEFTDISSEEFRTYDFTESGSVTIKNPLYLNVSKNGHRLFDDDGVSHYIPYGWRHLYWKARPGKANFVK